MNSTGIGRTPNFNTTANGHKRKKGKHNKRGKLLMSEHLRNLGALCRYQLVLRRKEGCNAHDIPVAITFAITSASRSDSQSLRWQVDRDAHGQQPHRQKRIALDSCFKLAAVNTGTFLCRSQQRNWTGGMRPLSMTGRKKSTTVIKYHIHPAQRHHSHP